ncbi:Wzz/FepE/Etk N-terminal domain-containing protein [Motilimonas sp. 1_MG-2023]|uniref:Wzz/FepE/Etk N-terminal domain-containing protein n=1 Tax=Motilimonas sp. 1_MG-2023 TaxID=3062672 RepID=UPI0026E1487B|nr:Wzz/FepE/Etk N-terminal domain-containing protein [Motilimonas sp. 1_MG-2023]MDO6528219.1 Wzz/FepE/Etk N-terminal domain-containing protein [Motilimonas sp. 1_MG-2023]
MAATPAYKFKNMTQDIKFNQISTNSDYSNHKVVDEIDLKELFSIIWNGKYWVIFFTLLFTVAAVAFAITQPNYYKSQVLLSPSSSSGGTGGLGQLGGLAALAGVNIGGAKGDKTQLAIAVLKSREFRTTFIDKY